MNDNRELIDAVIDGDADGAKRIAGEALAAGSDPEDLVNGSLIPAMDEVGNRFEEGEYYLPELLISSRAMKAAFELIRPGLAEKGAEPVGRAVIGTVAGDLHDIGKNLVGSLLEGGGFDVIDLGADVPAVKFIEALEKNKAGIVALSSLLSTTMPVMKNVVDELEERGLRESVKVMVGGAPVTQAYADEIGADGYASNARGAVVEARRLL